MLPKSHKFTSPSEFTRTIKRGRRAGSRTVVVHLWDHATEADNEDPATCGGPRFGLIVSKAVGNAVIRHRASRRLRHVCAGLVDELPATMNVVIRALPRAGDATSEQLGHDIRRALAKLGVGDRERRS
ncbi:ribonuclease P protein component [Corynebacterium halotolerans]|uniref:Ribonuclease P protein component n=1 Tax=Corynebacterium halotolerans YIM 70093 = DSM 44683 TaxID=1121362 RepID=M1NR08_9CORY|nr:ribonuclease P protein component [Corynebacterium halotolerans]AGF73808.1 ribonuclease P protein component [Corynebacterium halotolerans YIM 70093 = DSM 44683]